MSDVNMTQETVHPLDENPGERITSLTAQIVSEFEVAMGSVTRVKAVCKELAEFLQTAPVFPDRPQLELLVSAVGKRTGAMVEPLFDLLIQLSARIDDPWVVLEGMLSVRDTALMRRTLERTLRLAEIGKLLVDREVLQFFAESVEKEGSPIREAEHLKILAKIMQMAALPQQDVRQDPTLWLYLSSDQVPLRRLAARILDAEARPVSAEVISAVLGGEAVPALAPDVGFKRVTHLDLLHLIPAPGQPPPTISGVRDAE